MTVFTLYNKNTPLSIIRVHRDIVNVEYFSDVLSHLFKSPAEWVISRATAYTRHNILEIFKLSEIYTTEQYLQATHGVAATDTFWFKEESSNVKWSDVSVFDNKISSLIAEAAINGAYLLGNANAKSPSPQYQIAGTADKCIKRINGELVFYKTSGAVEFDMNTRPYMEAIVTQVAKQLSFETPVTYNVIEKQLPTGHYRPYCYCPLITDVNTGLIDYCDSRFSGKTVQELLRLFKTSGDKTSTTRLCEMLILDSLCLNIDRHDANYAFTFDTNTLQYKNFSNAFDFDCSLGSLFGTNGLSTDELYNKIFNIGSRMNIKDFNHLALVGMTKSIYDKLNTVKHLDIDFTNMKGLTASRRRFIEYALNRRLTEIITLAKQ